MTRSADWFHQRTEERQQRLQSCRYAVEKCDSGGMHKMFAESLCVCACVHVQLFLFKSLSVNPSLPLPLPHLRLPSKRFTSKCHFLTRKPSSRLVRKLKLKSAQLRWNVDLWIPSNPLRFCAPCSSAMVKTQTNGLQKRRPALLPDG